MVASTGYGEAEISEAVEAITEAAARSGADGFEELARSARPTLLRVAQGVTGRREDAEDAVQSSLLKAMPRLAAGRRAGAVAAAGVRAPNSRQHVPVGLAEVGFQGGCRGNARTRPGIRNRRS